MSAYSTMHCHKHGDWDMDLDNPGDCPQCPDKDEVIKELCEALEENNKALRVLDTMLKKERFSSADIARRMVCRNDELLRKVRGDSQTAPEPGPTNG